MLTKNRISQIKSLSTKKGRVELGEFVAEGQKMLEEMINSDFEIVEVYYISQVQETIDAICKGVNAIKISTNDMSRISQLKTPSPVLVVVKIPQTHEVLECSDELVLALDSIQDPGNMGTIIRIADWYGIKKIYCSHNSVDIYSSKVVQATMGAISRVKIYYVDLVEFLSKTKMPVYGTFLEGENIYTKKLSVSGVIVMGNEGSGISKEVERYVNQKIFIPPYPADVLTSESLNVAVATAICVSEFRRVEYSSK